ncbi:AAA family ATPase [Sinorhizobium meliloti]|uniref:AAA family ATPase n=1 Tax=Rhizobium meliloti TaxID=382 RepID=UPI00299DAFF3|nr:AAA family ATPase [Sinorhizobium meliloti]
MDAASDTTRKPVLHTIRGSKFGMSEPKPLEYIDGQEMFLAAAVNYLTGAGAIGKSLMALQLACAIALPERDYPESHWLGRPVEKRGKVLFVSGEDDTDAIHRRVLDIAAAEGFNACHLGNLEIANLTLTADKALFSGQRNGASKTPLFAALENTVAAMMPVAIFLDNRAQLCDIDELNRSAATKVGNHLHLLAKAWNAAVVVLAHPSLSGLNSKTGNSGSTAWLNSVRNQVNMVRPDDAEGGADDGRRQLIVPKANYGPMGRVMNVRWELGCYHCTDKPERAGSDIGRADRAERVFLALLNLHTDRGVWVSARPKASNYAPKVFGGHPKREGTTPKMFAAAMETLFEKGLIRAVQHGSPSDDAWKLEVVKCNF